MNNPNDLTSVIREHLKPILQSYDKDKNSTLDKEELRALLADNLGVPAAQITQDQLDWHFSKIDENGDGKITFEEYVLVSWHSLTTSSWSAPKIRRRRYRRKRKRKERRLNQKKVTRTSWLTWLNSGSWWRTLSNHSTLRLLKRWSSGISTKSIRMVLEESPSRSSLPLSESTINDTNYHKMIQTSIIISFFPVPHESLQVFQVLLFQEIPFLSEIFEVVEWFLPFGLFSFRLDFL